MLLCWNNYLEICFCGTALEYKGTLYCDWSLQCDFHFVLALLLALANMFLLFTFFLVLNVKRFLKKHTPNQEVEMQPVLQVEAVAQMEEGQEDEEANAVAHVFCEAPVG